MSENDKNTKVFITSASGKSGTTILSWLLCQHSFLKQEKIQEEMLLARIFNLDAVLDFDLHMTDFQGDAIYKSKKNYRLIENLYQEMVNPQGYQYSAVKFVEFQGYRFLRYWYPTAPIISIARNPVDWWSSRVDWAYKQQRKPVDLKYWLLHIIKPSVYSMVNTQNVYNLFYEDLIMEPEKQMNLIHDYLGWTREKINLSGHEKIYQEFTAVDPIDTVSENNLVRETIDRGKVRVPHDEKTYIWTTISSDQVMKNFFTRYL